MCQQKRVASPYSLIGKSSSPFYWLSGSLANQKTGRQLGAPMIIITVTGYKGGIGKSTTAFHLAAYFSDLGKTVLIDGDSNRTALKWAGRSEAPLPFTVADQRQAMKIVDRKSVV